MPSVDPTTKAISTEGNATSSATRVPYRTRERLSRPRESVPSRWFQLGPASMWVTLIVSGLYGEMSGAKIAARTRRTITTSAVEAAGRRSTSRANERSPRGW